MAKPCNFILALAAFAVIPVSAQAQQFPLTSKAIVIDLTSPSQLQAPQTLSPRPSSPMPTLNRRQFQRIKYALSSRSAMSSSGLRSGGVRVPLNKGSAAAYVAPSNYGTRCDDAGCIPYTTARVANTTVASSATTSVQPVGGMPYVATGRLLMARRTAGRFDSVCSASLIGRGLVVTAAHCIQEYGLGAAGTVKSVRFIPANNGNTLNSGPYGGWDVGFISQPMAYFNGTDTCSDPGIVCNNDVAVLVLNKNSAGRYPFAVPQIYYYGYSANGYGSTTKVPGVTGTFGQITQLGYPCGLDNCQLMQRNDSIGGFIGSGTGSSPKQIMIGSQMTGGSSGGPWLANFGSTSSLTGDSSPGAAPLRNQVTAVTGWGYVGESSGIQIMGASQFAQNSQFPKASYSSDGVDYGPGNIGYLVNEACRSNGRAKGKSKGACWHAR